MRISLPDRPGALGQVASALATVGADIQWVEVVSRDAGQVTDDFMVELPDTAMPDEAVSACQALEGTRVLWCSRYPAGSGLALDIELLETMLSDPDNALRRVIESAAEVFHVHWAALIDAPSGHVIYASDMAPPLDDESVAGLQPFDQAHVAELPDDWIPDWIETVAAIVPVGQNNTVVVGRNGGPPFERSELARLRYIASLGAVQMRA